jgi:hypothetical protein
VRSFPVVFFFLSSDEAQQRPARPVAEARASALSPLVIHGVVDLLQVVLHKFLYQFSMDLRMPYSSSMHRSQIRLDKPR